MKRNLFTGSEVSGQRSAEAHRQPWGNSREVLRRPSTTLGRLSRSTPRSLATFDQSLRNAPVVTMRYERWYALSNTAHTSTDTASMSSSPTVRLACATRTLRGRARSSKPPPLQTNSPRQALSRSSKHVVSDSSPVIASGTDAANHEPEIAARNVSTTLRQVERELCLLAGPLPARGDALRERAAKPLVRPRRSARRGARHDRIRPRMRSRRAVLGRR
jgi:hypothetical protein